MLRRILLKSLLAGIIICCLGIYINYSATALTHEFLYHTLNNVHMTPLVSLASPPPPPHSSLPPPICRRFSRRSGDNDDVSHGVRQDSAAAGREVRHPSLQGPHPLCLHYSQRTRVPWALQRSQLSPVWLHTQGQCAVSLHHSKMFKLNLCCIIGKPQCM